MGWAIRITPQDAPQVSLPPSLVQVLSAASVGAPAWCCWPSPHQGAHSAATHPSTADPPATGHAIHDLEHAVLNPIRINKKHNQLGSTATTQLRSRPDALMLQGNGQQARWSQPWNVGTATWPVLSCCRLAHMAMDPWACLWPCPSTRANTSCACCCCRWMWRTTWTCCTLCRSLRSLMSSSTTGGQSWSSGWSRRWVALGGGGAPGQCKGPCTPTGPLQRL